MTVKDLIRAAWRTGAPRPTVLPDQEEPAPDVVAGPKEAERGGRPATYAAATWFQPNLGALTVHVWMDTETGDVEWHHGPRDEGADVRAPDEMDWPEDPPADG